MFLKSILTKHHEGVVRRWAVPDNIHIDFFEFSDNYANFASEILNPPATNASPDSFPLVSHSGIPFGIPFIGNAKLV